ncbi:hypothetical protein HYT23_06410 [Candidatus Pacearchaeota archaeon]|nr:hypothetical protein [Candidatus Pacearchaeota archaeon]
MAQNDVAEIKRREYGYLAGQTIASEGEKGIDSARTLLRKTPLQVQDSVAQERLEASYDSDDAVARMADREHRTYLVTLNRQDVSALPQIYDRAASKLSGPAQEGLTKFLQRYAGKTIGDMKRTAHEADSRRKAEPGLYTDKDVQDAMETLQKMQPYLQITGALQGMHFKPIMRDIEAENEKASLKSLETALTSGQL